MYIILILSLVTSLVIISINARYSLDSYSNGYWSKDSQTKRFNFQEHNVNESINSICRVDVNYCKALDDGSGELVFTSLELDGKILSITTSSAFSGFTSMKINADKTAVVFTHSISDLDRRTEFIGGTAFLPGSIVCEDASTLPCTGSSLIKSITLHPETRLIFVEDRLAEIEILLLDPDVTGNENAQLNKEKGQLQNEVHSLVAAIGAREDLIP